MDQTRAAWESASQKHVREYDELLAFAASGASLVADERRLLAGVLQTGPAVVHLQSGHGADDIALIEAGARSVIGVDYSEVAVRAAQRRADDLGADCRYVVAALPGAPLPDRCADLVYTGKGALIWMRDLTAWAADAARLLRPGGTLFAFEEHPAAPLWTWDADEPRIRPDRDYFGDSHVNDSFPAGGAARHLGSFGQVILLQILLGAALVFAGTGHLTFARAEFQAQVPSWVPLDADVVVLASGVVEILLGLALLTVWRQPARGLVGAVVAAFFIAVFPGNIAQFAEQKDGFGLDTDTARGVRLLFQPVLVVWALAATHAVSAWRGWRAGGAQRR